MRVFFGGVCGFVVVALVASACSKSGDDYLEWHRMHDRITREEFAAAFPILNLAGTEARPVAQDGTSPFAVAIMFKWDYFSDSYSYAFCSASHVGPGKATTNAHCTENIYDLENLYLVYYNKGGEKKFTKPLKINYQGSVSSFDVAVLELTPSADAEWDMLTGSVANAATAGEEKGKDGPLAVTVWAFDPVATATGASAMAFHPRQCTMTRKIPTVTAFKKNGDKTKINFSTSVNVANHMILESCDAVTIQGNSGSVVTAKSSYKEPIGVNHWSYAIDAKQLEEYDRFEMTGANGVVLLDDKMNFIRWNEDGSKEEQRKAFAVGTVFASILKQIPDVFTNHRQRWESAPTPEASPSPVP